MDTVSPENLDAEAVTDDIFDILLIAYMSGIEEANRQLGASKEFTFSEFQNALYKEIDGKTYIDRVREHIADNKPEEVIVVADTEAHRMFNTGGYDVARDIPGLMKTWVTMDDDRVRSTHEYLEGVKVPFDEKFYTYDGDSARFPGDFEKAQNVVNCRCMLVYSRD